MVVGAGRAARVLKLLRFRVKSNVSLFASILENGFGLDICRGRRLGGGVDNDGIALGSLVLMAFARLIVGGVAVIENVIVAEVVLGVWVAALLVVIAVIAAGVFAAWWQGWTRRACRAAFGTLAGKLGNLVAGESTENGNIVGSGFIADAGIIESFGADEGASNLGPFGIEGNFPTIAIGRKPHGPVGTGIPVVLLRGRWIRRVGRVISRRRR